MTGRVALASSRLQLRPWRPADVNDVLAYASSEEFSRFIPLPRPYTLEDAEQWVATSIATSWDAHPRWALVIDGHVEGDVNLRISSDDATAAIGYGISPRHWNKGLMTEAAGIAIAWAFRSLEIAKIWATADARNVASWRVMEKLGMQREAYLRSHRVLRGERVDVVQYGLLRREWKPGVDGTVE